MNDKLLCTLLDAIILAPILTMVLVPIIVIGFVKISDRIKEKK